MGNLSLPLLVDKPSYEVRNSPAGGIGRRVSKYAAPALRDDRDLVLSAVRTARFSFRFASERLRSDKSVLLEALKIKPHSFRYASEALRNDPELALKAVKRSAKALKFASDDMKKRMSKIPDKEFSNPQRNPIQFCIHEFSYS